MELKREYESYEAKIEVLKKCLGAWPPPFDPPRYIQVAGGQSGTRQLCRIVKSFLPSAIDKPLYEHIDRSKPNPDDFTLKGEDIYLRYNVHQIEPRFLHNPILLYFLRYSPKVILLLREDHLMHSISKYYRELRAPEVPAGSSDLPPLTDFARLDVLIHGSIRFAETMKKIIRVFTSADRLFCLTHHDLYHSQTLKSIRELTRFMGLNPQDIEFSMRCFKQTLVDAIPNAREICDRYQRDLEEKQAWIPDGFDMTRMNQVVKALLEDFFALNLPPSEQPTRVLA